MTDNRPKLKRRYGQVFLKDQNILDKIVDLVTPQSQVLEIGCGDGWLSYRLAMVARQLTIIEIDPAFAAVTQDRLAEFRNFNITTADFCAVGLQFLTEPVHVVSNTPYYLSGKIIEILARDREMLRGATLMVQREFAKKLMAPPGEKNYGSYGIFVHYFFDVQWKFPVSRQCFRPVPNVDSAVIHLVPRDSLPLGPNPDDFFSFVRAGFWGRRKQLMVALTRAPGARWTTDQLQRLEFFNENPKIRAQDLTLSDFIGLYESTLKLKFASPVLAPIHLDKKRG